ncbi:Tat pathway signal sequence domain-containing protein [Caballeronia calidae]|uniref:Tat pathway signal sequence domain-containing protein n=1 Tax=Caballeronia calidae TaxID=1777139 RepID=A0A157ZQH6_9BURK|nr:YXWGXW repeat-containing protein [Caballeronia calidae]SAK47774.1 Tat pathway signal sequence domain-containing protein [Caballeronia calidae]
MKLSFRHLAAQAALVAAGVVCASGAFADVVIVAPSAPPAPRYEPVPPPRAGFVWVTGHWSWEGRYVWQAGRWMEARAGQRWVPGVWAPFRGQYRYVPGHWI